jgi:hypothetical protein
MKELKENIKQLHRALEKYSQKVRNRRADNDYSLPQVDQALQI